MKEVVLITPYTAGLLCILIVVLIWTAAGFATQYLETTLDFNAPFIFTYLSSSLFVLNLPFYYLFSKGKDADQTKKSDKDIPNNDQAYYQLDTQDTEMITDNRASGGSLIDFPSEFDPLSPKKEASWFFRPIPVDHTQIELIQVVAVLSPLWFAGNFFYNYSLIFTSTSSSIVITNLNGAFTMFFSYMCGVEDWASNKIVGVILCFCGVVLVSLGDRTSAQLTGSSIMFGDACAAVGAVGYGLYTTFIRLKIPDGSKNISMSLLFGYMGLVNLVLLLPVMVMLFITGSGGIQKLNGSILAFIFCEEVLDTVVANYLYARATILTAPSVAAVGESLTIPLSIMVDMVLANPSSVADSRITMYSVAGGALVTLGFLMLALSPSLVWCEKQKP